MKKADFIKIGFKLFYLGFNYLIPKSFFTSEVMSIPLEYNKIDFSITYFKPFAAATLLIEFLTFNSIGFNKAPSFSETMTCGEHNWRSPVAHKPKTHLRPDWLLICQSPNKRLRYQHSPMHQTHLLSSVKQHMTQDDH